MKGAGWARIGGAPATLAWFAGQPPAIPQKSKIIMRVNHREAELENHDRGLDYDLPRLLQRRGMLKLVAGAGLAGGLITLGACATADDHRAAPRAARRAADRDGRPRRWRVRAGGSAAENQRTAEGEIPEETAGPYPGDGSNGANVLTESGVVRSDITSSFGSARPRPRASR